jgi:hypothetical protein
MVYQILASSRVFGPNTIEFPVRGVYILLDLMADLFCCLEMKERTFESNQTIAVLS